MAETNNRKIVQGEDTRYDGREGEIEAIDAIGQLHGTWGGLAVIPEADEFIVIGGIFLE